MEPIFFASDFAIITLKLVDRVLVVQYKEEFNAFRFVSEGLWAVVIGNGVGYAFAPLGASCL